MVTKTKTVEAVEQEVKTPSGIELKGLEEFMEDLKQGEAIYPPEMHWPKLEDIQTELEEPFSEDLFEYLPKGGVNLTYVAWNEYVKRLNRLAYGHWSSRITGVYGQGNETVMTVEVTIYGTSHEDTSDPDTPTSAYATALKRACSKFGLGLHLYDLGGKKGGPKSSYPRSSGTPYENTQSAQPNGTYQTTSSGSGKPTPRMAQNLMERNRVPKAVVDGLDYETASAMLNDFIQQHMKLEQVADKYGFVLPSDGLPIR